MNPKEIYTENYAFAKKQKERKKKILKIISLVFIALIFLALIYGVISNLDFFKTKEETVSSVFNQEQLEKRIQSDKQRAQSYKDANIPYRDSQNRFSIQFLTPFVSDRIAVVINSEKDYDKVKKEADQIIEQAKKKVQISTVTYVNSF